MKYKDVVHGEFNIRELVILELINSPTLQRLKSVDQTGYDPYTKRERVNRFDHSVGVYLLLKKYKASIEEQIAGLIHDVSHSCFSHCIDYVLRNGSGKTQSLQDDVFESFVKKTEIVDIIEKYGFDINYILNDKNFSLEEKDLPDLCADRIDYSLRDAFSFQEVSKKDRDNIFKNLVAENQNWIFKNLESARKYANLFFKMNIKYYSGFQSAVMFRTVGDFLKYSLKKEYIIEEDLYTTDSFVIQKIKKFINQDKQLALLWRRMNNKTRIINNPNDYDVQIFCKSRIVDPLFKNDDQIKRLSGIDREWKGMISRESCPKQYFLKFIK